MENQTSFDLSIAIQQWRQNLAQSSAFRHADLDELESHLHDSMPPLQKAGLSPEEAFMIASRRIGPLQALEPEFRKSNTRSVWLERVLWACMILQGSRMLFEFARINRVPIVMAFVFLVGFALLAGSAPGQRLVRWLLSRPAWTAVALLFLGLGNRVLEQSSMVRSTFGGPALFGMRWPMRVTSEYWYLRLQIRFVGLISELVACSVLIAVLLMSRRTDREIAEG
jgi:hypothetical protein